MSAWKACDIRGKYPEEVSPELLADVGQRAASILPPGARVLVAGDMRLSTPGLKAALIGGLLGGGLQVLDAGQIPTPVAYFAHRECATEAVFIVTASHNPADWNGLKLMIGDLPPDEALFERLRAAMPRQAVTPGSREVVEPLPAYLSALRERWKRLGGKGLRVVLDAGNGAWSEIAPAFFESLGFDVERLFCDVDGRFPNRPPDSARPANLTALSRRAPGTGAALGIAWDGDGDRVAFVDGAGRPLTADETALLLVRYLLRGSSAEPVTYDVKLSDAVRRTVIECGGVPLVERSGHAFLKRRMISANCLFGCEASGHYFYRELHGGDDGLFSALLVTEMVARDGPLERLRLRLPEIFITPDLRVRGARASYEEAISRLRGVFADAEATTVDGLRLATRDGSVLVRRSVTEQAFTLRIEGHDADSLGRLVDRCAAALSDIAPDLPSQVRG